MSAASRVKFEFGRHETFAVREGWLGKGLGRIRDMEGRFRADLESADALGLGSRMVKSLQYWLEATGLADPGESKGRERVIHPSDLGSEMLNRDPYLEFPCTWWILHVVLARREGSVLALVLQRLQGADLRQDRRRRCVRAPRAGAVDQTDHSCGHRAGRGLPIVRLRIERPGSDPGPRRRNHVSPALAGASREAFRHGVQKTL